MRYLDDKRFNEIFLNGKFKRYGDCGKVCYKEISKYAILYSPEIDGDPHYECDDSIGVLVKDFSEPIPFSILKDFLCHFKEDWVYMKCHYVSFRDSPDNRYIPIEIEDIINNQKPIYSVLFYCLDDTGLRYLNYFLKLINSEQ